MDLDPTKKNVPRKVKFAPKAPPKRVNKLVLPKAEKLESNQDDVKAERLLQRLNESSATGKPRVDRKVPVGSTKVAFGYGGSSSIRSYKKINNNLGSSSAGGADQGVEKEYKEPWDYYSYYPVTHPLRRPYSGNPEILDKEEFAEDPHSVSYDENGINSAEELGLLDEDGENNLIFLQLPKTLPMVKPEEVHETDNKTNPTKNSGKSKRPCKLEELPAGFMGKILVYKSGAVKMKIGNVLYDVASGLNTLFGQDIVAINEENKQCCNLGELSKRAVLTPDIDSILDAYSDL